MQSHSAPRVVVEMGIVAALSFGSPDAALMAQTNIARVGTGHRWAHNASATSNANRRLAAGLNDGNPSASVRLGTPETVAAHQAGGVLWSSPQAVASVEFIGGAWTSTGDGAFCAELTLQATADGVTWLNTGWGVVPAYPYNTGGAVGARYRFSGAPISARGVRISGQLRCAAQSSDWANVREIFVFSSNGSTACALPGYPTPDCTGVPPGTLLTELPLNDEGAYRVTTDGEVIDSKHIAGDLLITARNVTIRNSQIDGHVINEYGPNHYGPFTISDSTVGPATGCITSPGVGESDYTAIRVHIRGMDDGFRVSGNNITIRDSYVRLCSSPGSHSDGVQSYCPIDACSGVTLAHNTFDQRFAPDHTAPIFLTDPQLADVRLTNNLVAGGVYSLFLEWHSGPNWTVAGNKIVGGTWDYGEVTTEDTCAHMDWGADNAVVTIDTNYRVTSTIRELPCIP